jgi:hypothetical protein
VDDLKPTWRRLMKGPEKKMISVNENQKRRYDTKAMQNQYSPGQHVWIASKTRKKGRCPKLQVHWNGPYIVLQAVSDLVYKVRRSKAEKPKYVHHDQMKLFRGEVNERVNAL